MSPQKIPELPKNPNYKELENYKQGLQIGDAVSTGPAGSVFTLTDDHMDVGVITVVGKSSASEHGHKLTQGTVIIRRGETEIIVSPKNNVSSNEGKELYPEEQVLIKNMASEARTKDKILRSENKTKHTSHAPMPDQ